MTDNDLIRIRNGGLNGGLSERDESERDESEQPPGWDILGFEAFDLLVIGLQVVIILTAVPLNPILSHPVFQFVIGVSFFVAMYLLSRTSTFARGIKKISEEHEYLWGIIFVGGAVLGVLILALFIFRPIKIGLDLIGLDSSWLPAVGVPLSVVALGFLPWLSHRAEQKDLGKNGDFRDQPWVVMYLGRSVILIMANLILFSMRENLAEEIQAVNLINTIGIMVLFYIPVRMQEMYLHPNGPHFQSLLQTAVMIGIGTTGISLAK